MTPLALRESKVLISPYGGGLVDLLVPPEERAALKAHANTLPSVQMSDRAVCDLEIMAVGGFSPVAQFMGAADFESVVADMRLADGTLFPIPIVLPVDDDFPASEGEDIALRDAKNNLLAVMTVEELYPWDRAAFAMHVLGTQDPRHPVVAESTRWGSRMAAGRLRVLELPRTCG